MTTKLNQLANVVYQILADRHGSAYADEKKQSHLQHQDRFETLAWVGTALDAQNLHTLASRLGIEVQDLTNASALARKI